MIFINNALKNFYNRIFAQSKTQFGKKINIELFKIFFCYPLD